MHAQGKRLTQMAGIWDCDHRNMLQTFRRRQETKGAIQSTDFKLPIHVFVAYTRSSQSSIVGCTRFHFRRRGATKYDAEARVVHGAN